jgi:dTDP-4-dehydrorhamnose reductase
MLNRLAFLFNGHCGKIISKYSFCQKILKNPTKKGTGGLIKEGKAITDYALIVNRNRFFSLII